MYAPGKAVRTTGKAVRTTRNAVANTVYGFAMHRTHVGHDRRGRCNARERASRGRNTLADDAEQPEEMREASMIDRERAAIVQLHLINDREQPAVVPALTKARMFHEGDDAHTRTRPRSAWRQHRSPTGSWRRTTSRGLCARRERGAGKSRESRSTGKGAARGRRRRDPRRLRGEDGRARARRTRERASRRLHEFSGADR